MAFLPSLRRATVRGASPPPSPALPIERKAGPPAAVSSSQVGRAYKAPGSTEAAVRDVMLPVTWLYKAMTTIAYNAARVPVVVREGDRWSGPEVDHEITRLLNDAPNPYEQSIVFRFRLSLQYLLSERGVFIERIPSNGGGTAEMHLLPPDLTAPLPADTGSRAVTPDGVFNSSIVGFELTDRNSNRVVLPPEEVVWVRMPHPTDPYRSMTALTALNLSARIDQLARTFQASFLQNDGKLGGLIAVKGEMSDEVADEIEASMSLGPGGAGRWRAIEADDVDLVEMASSPRDAQYVEQRATTKEEILIGMGVPESVAGNASGRTFANAEAELLGFWRETMRPHMDMVAAPFDRLLGDPDLFLGFDTSDIPVLERDKRLYETHVMELFKGGLLTLDEARSEIGRDPLGVPDSEVVWLPNSVSPVGDEANDAPPVPAPPNVTRLPQPPVADDADDDDVSAQG